ncbi:MAG: LysR family transcriptional regulator [Beijerinckiaceae bacterium]
MDIRSIRLVLALAEHRHFARAAAACGISQPAFSARIQGLEHELGVRLVERGRAFERFTVEGESLLPRLREIVALADSVAQDASGKAEELSGQLRVAAIPTQLLTAGRLAAEIRARHPGVHVAIHSRTAKAIDAALDQYEADIGISYADGGRPDRYEMTALPSESYVLARPAALGQGWPEGGVAWADAAAMPLALLTPDMQNRQIVDAAFRAANARPEVAIESDTLTALMGAVRQGAAAAILPVAQAGMLAAEGDVSLHPLIDPEVRRDIGLYALKREPQLPAVRAAFDCAAALR